MSIVVIKKPERTINGHLSKWNAVHHPIEFHVQRQDHQVIMKYKPGTSTVRIKLTSAVPSSVAVGQKIYYSSPSQKYTWTVLQIVGNLIITDGTTTGTIYGGFVNFLDANKNYFVETQVYYVNTENTTVLLGTLRHKPNLEAISKINIQEWLKTIATYDDRFNYDAINKAIQGEGGKFSARCREFYNNTFFAFGTFIQLGYWTNSAKQIQDLYGTNMGEYVPTLDEEREDKAKFLSVFEQPTYFPGFPFSLSFIYSDNMLNHQITREESVKDVNGNEVDTSSTNLNTNHRFFVNRLMIEQDYTSNIKSLEVWLDAGEETVSPEIESPVDGYSNGTIFDPRRPTESIKYVRSL